MQQLDAATLQTWSCFICGTEGTLHTLGYSPEVLRPEQPALLFSLRMPLSLGWCEHRSETLQWPAGISIEASEKAMGGIHHIIAASLSGWRCVRLSPLSILEYSDTARYVSKMSCT